jgi:hypothetical protein
MSQPQAMWQKLTSTAAVACTSNRLRASWQLAVLTQLDERPRLEVRGRDFLVACVSDRVDRDRYYAALGCCLPPCVNWRALRRKERSPRATPRGHCA